MTVGAEDKSYHGIHTYHGSAACAEEGQRYADNGSDLEHHADIHQAVCENKSESAHAYELTEMVPAKAAVAEYLKAYISKDDYYAESSYKTALVTMKSLCISGTVI